MTLDNKERQSTCRDSANEIWGRLSNEIRRNEFAALTLLGVWAEAYWP